MGVVDDATNSDAVGELECGNIARLRERTAQGDDAFKLLVGVVRCVRCRAGLEGDGRVEDGVFGTCALIDGGSVDVGLEGRSGLSQGLGDAVELGLVEVTATDEGLDLAGTVVEGEQRALDAGVRSSETRTGARERTLR